MGEPWHVFCFYHFVDYSTLSFKGKMLTELYFLFLFFLLHYYLTLLF